MLDREKIISTLTRWNDAWNDHDLERVLALLHDEVEFENWTDGSVKGKAALRQAWAPWFSNHGGFRFTTEDLFVDEKAGKVLFRWPLDWPPSERGFEGRPERRRGVDEMHFRDGLIVKKYTYFKTTFEIGGKRVKLTAANP